MGGETVPRSSTTKLLGVHIDDKQNWLEHFTSLQSDLNKRTFQIRRISNQIPKKQVLKVVQCIWMSRLRYGLQLCNQVRTTNEDPTNKLMSRIQVTQNKMLRMLDRAFLKDHITSASLLTKYNLPSINQLSAEIKLTEAWKSTHIVDYPIKMDEFNPNRVHTERLVRTGTTKHWNDEARTTAAKMSFSRDMAKLWNSAPIRITNATCLSGAKREIKIFCKTLAL